MKNDETSIKVKKATLSRFRKARRKLEYIRDMDTKSDDAALVIIIDEWCRLFPGDSLPVKEPEPAA